MLSNFVGCFAFVMVLLTEAPLYFSDGLRCYTCVSNKSWEDCDDNLRMLDCPAGHDEVCIKEQQVRYNEDNENVQQLFSRTCGTADLCTDKNCKKVGIRCDPKCCHTDLCNTATTVATTRTMCVIRLLLVNFIVILLL